MSNNTCLGCKKRHVGCHSTCEIYLNYRKELNKTLIKQWEKDRCERYYWEDVKKARRKGLQ